MEDVEDVLAKVVDLEAKMANDNQPKIDRNKPCPMNPGQIILGTNAVTILITSTTTEAADFNTVDVMEDASMVDDEVAVVTTTIINSKIKVSMTITIITIKKILTVLLGNHIQII